MQLEKLASKIAGRDKNSFEELYSALMPTVYSVCLGIVRNRSIAEEIAQDTFVAVWEKIGSYGGKGFKTWIVSIARNKAFNAVRAGKREVAFDYTENENLGGGYTIDEQADAHGILEAVLRVLDGDEREIVLMRNSGMKVKEIAAVLGIPRGTVSWKYSQALGRMKKYLEGVQ